MAGNVEKAKIPGRLLLAFLKQRVKNAIGDEITDELGDIGENLLGESLDSWLSGKPRQIEQAEEKARACFEEACRQQGLDDRFAQWMASLPLDDLPALQRAIARLPQQVDDSELRRALQAEIAAWKDLDSTQAQQAAELYLDCLKRGLATQRDFQQDILVKEVLAMARQIAKLRKDTALILAAVQRIEAKLDSGYGEEGLAAVKDDKKQVQLILEGDIDQWDHDKEVALLTLLAALLSVDRSKIRVLHVMAGSILVTLELSGTAIDQLRKLALKRDVRLQNSGILAILIDDEPIINFSNLQPVQGRADEYEYQPPPCRPSKRCKT